MMKKTLYFGSPAYLKTRYEQLVIEKQEDGELIVLPIEDIGVIVIDHAHITITSGLMAKLLGNNVALITCNATHHPTGLLLNLDGHSLQSRQFGAQLDASLPLRKKLWQQTISAKIANQAAVLKQRGKESLYLLNLSKTVRTGDSEHAEAKAAAYYWKNLFPAFMHFRRDRFGFPPNNLFNYGYAILRAVVARSLVGSGLLPTLGIFHRNQYNAYCLADDIMEPYRPFVDLLICSMINPDDPILELTPEVKRQMLQVPAIDVTIKGEQSPLMVAVQRTTASVAKCFEGKAKSIIYAQLGGK